MKKGDDAKSTKDVKEGDGFILSYSNHSYENHSFYILFVMALRSLKSNKSLIPIKDFTN